MEWLVGADPYGSGTCPATAHQGSLGHPAENIAAAAAAAAAAATTVTGTVPAGTEGCRRQGSGQPAGGDVLQTRCYGHRGGWLSWEPEAGRDELGRAALPYDLGTQPGGEVGTGQKREKLGAGGV